MTSPIIFRESSNLNFLRSSIESEVRRVTKPTWTSLIRDTLNAGVPFTSRNWLERNLQPVGKHLGIRTPLTFQVLRRSFATHNQKQLKNVQAHLGHQSPELLQTSMWLRYRRFAAPKNAMQQRLRL